MPWKETSAMDQRIQLIADWLSKDFTKSGLCRAYGISRPTADKWIERYAKQGTQGLEELSRAPHTQLNQTAEELRAMIVKTKLTHQRWGPKKVMEFSMLSSASTKLPKSISETPVRVLPMCSVHLLPLTPVRTPF